MTTTKKTTTLTGEVTKINLGCVEFEGLLLSNGEFAIAVPQVAALFKFANMHAARDLKTLLGDGSKFAKVRSFR